MLNLLIVLNVLELVQLRRLQHVQLALEKGIWRPSATGSVDAEALYSDHCPKCGGSNFEYIVLTCWKCSANTWLRQHSAELGCYYYEMGEPLTYALLKKNCTICVGNGTVTNTTRCTNCSGSGTINCETCTGLGTVACSGCSGYGSTTCGNCGGNGTTTKAINCSHGCEPNSTHYYCSSHGSSVSQYH